MSDGEIGAMAAENKTLRKRVVRMMRECRRLEFMASREKARADEAESKLRAIREAMGE